MVRTYICETPNPVPESQVNHKEIFLLFHECSYKKWILCVSCGFWSILLETLNNILIRQLFLEIKWKDGLDLKFFA